MQICARNVKQCSPVKRRRGHQSWCQGSMPAATALAGNGAVGLQRAFRPHSEDSGPACRSGTHGNTAIRVVFELSNYTSASPLPITLKQGSSHTRFPWSLKGVGVLLCNKARTRASQETQVLKTCSAFLQPKNKLPNPALAKGNRPLSEY